eukprot:1329221-Amorphochlora_amoeboformis.AAC.1
METSEEKDNEEQTERDDRGQKRVKIERDKGRGRELKRGGEDPEPYDSALESNTSADPLGDVFLKESGYYKYSRE